MTSLLTADRKRYAGLVLLTLIPCALVMNLWLLGDAPLAGTEGHRALTAHEMLQSGNWVVPTLYGETYLRKPPLTYWLIAAAETLTGTANEFTWRLPSAIATVLTAVLVWLFGWRWFGRLAGIVSGFSMLALVALWSQNRSADIDSLNTLATTACALLLVEIGFGATRSTWRWAPALMLATTSMLLLKGPAGLPVVLGVLVGGSIAFMQWRWLTRPAIWLGLLGGAAAFGVWVGLVYLETKHATAQVDTSGASEAGLRLIPQNWRHVLKALAFAPTVFAYAVPHSAAVIFALLQRGRERVDAQQAKTAVVLAGGFIATLLFFALFMTTNPRYGYVALPMLCPLVGYVAERWRCGGFTDAGARSLRQVCTLLAVLLPAVAIITVHRSLDMQFEPVAVVWVIVGVNAVLGLVVVVLWIRQRAAAGAIGLALLVLTSSFGFNAYKVRERHERSTIHDAQAMIAIIGHGTAIHSEEGVLAFPELPYYANVECIRMPEGIPARLARDEPAWLLLVPDDWTRLTPEDRAKLTEPQLLHESGRSLLTYYAGRQPNTVADSDPKSDHENETSK